MKFCRFGDNRYGVVRGGDVLDVTEQVVKAVVAGPLQRGDVAIANLPAIAEMVRHAALGAPAGSVTDVKLLAPVLNPTKIIGAPVNYEAHLAESVADGGIHHSRIVRPIDAAGLFLKASSALVGCGEGVPIRFPERRTDHEVELAVVIGTPCSNVSPARALDVVAGYAIGLDMTVRGPEDRSFRKSVDGYAVLGPWLVTPDEFGNPEDVGFRLEVNGELRQQASTKHLIVGVRELIAWASNWYTLYPGDIIMTGTPEGVGPVRPGDVMRCEMQHVGEMRVAVRAAEGFQAKPPSAETVG